MFTQETLSQITKNFATSGRENPSFLQRLGYLNITRPSWCERDDLLFGLFKNKWSLIRHGNIVWGQIVQANKQLFKPGYSDCPGYVVFNPTANAEVDIDLLEHVAQAMMSLKGSTPKDPELAEVARSLTDEMTRCLHSKVPSQICGDENLYHASIFITRKHLPNRRLSRLLMPVLVSPEPPYYCIPVPSRYWTDDLVLWWHSQR